MKTATLASLLAISLLLLGASGCMGPTEGKKEFTVPSDAGPTAQQVPPDEAYTLTIRVVFETEAIPIQGAALVVFTATEEVQSDGYFYDWSRTSYQALASARTDANGTVIAYLAPGQEVNLVAGDVEHNTTEVRMKLVTGAAGQAASLTIPLYCTSLAFGGAGAFPLAAPARTDDVGEIVPFTFSENAAVNVGYLERIRTLEGALTWSNGMDGIGDLYAGISVGDSAPFQTGSDTMDLPSSATNTETVEVTGDTFEERRADMAAQGLSFAAVTDDYALSLDGLAFSFSGSATFEASTFKISG